MCRRPCRRRALRSPLRATLLALSSPVLLSRLPTKFVRHFRVGQGRDIAGLLPAGNRRQNAAHDAWAIGLILVTTASEMRSSSSRFVPSARYGICRRRGFPRCAKAAGVGIGRHAFIDHARGAERGARRRYRNGRRSHRYRPCLRAGQQRLSAPALPADSPILRPRAGFFRPSGGSANTDPSLFICPS